jgi:hypothetical protein
VEFGKPGKATQSACKGRTSAVVVDLSPQGDSEDLGNAVSWNCKGHTATSEQLVSVHHMSIVRRSFVIHVGHRDSYNFGHHHVLMKSRERVHKTHRVGTRTTSISATLVCVDRCS